MKRNCFYIGSILLCFLTIVSCQKDPAAGLAKSKNMMIEAGISNPRENCKSIWLEGDSIRIFSNTVLDGAAFVAKAGGLPKGSFTGSIVEGDQFYGAFPYDINTSFNGMFFSMNIPTQQPVSFWPMVGSGTKEDGIDFKGIGSLLSLKMTGKGTVTSIKIEGTDIDGNAAILSGTGMVDMTKSYPVLEMNSGNTYVDRAVNISLTSEEKRVNFFIPSENYKQLTITAMNEAGNTLSQKVDNVNLSSDEIREINMPVEFSATPDPVNADLSENGIANCYVVPSSGDYFFSAKLQDNTTLSGDGADYLWTDVACNWINGNSEIQNAVSPMDPEYIIKDISYDAPENKIHFTATGNIGNAVIALYRNTGGSRSIVWTWHIWVSGKSLEQMQVNWVSKNLSSKGQSIVWLDRNIGAINNTADNVGSNGLLYQWGRKDPFIGSRIIGSKANISGIDEAEAFGELSTPVMTNTAFGAGFGVSTTLTSINDIINNPMIFYAKDGNWATDTPLSSWGDGIAPFTTYQNYLKGTDPNENYTDGIRVGTKSNYDPCPPGYRVPTSEEMWLSFAAWNATDYPAWAGNVSSVMTDKTQSHIVSSYNDMTNTVLFPAFGHRDQGRMDYIGYAGYYWTSTINPENTAYAFRQLVASNMRVEGSGAFANARPLRCVAE